MFLAVSLYMMRKGNRKQRKDADIGLVFMKWMGAVGCKPWNCEQKLKIPWGVLWCISDVSSWSTKQLAGFQDWSAPVKLKTELPWNDTHFQSPELVQTPQSSRAEHKDCILFPFPKVCVWALPSIWEGWNFPSPQPCPGSLCFSGNPGVPSIVLCSLSPGHVST